MARNVYFSQAVKSEQNLYEDLVIESLKIFGQDVYYLPRTIVSRDDVLGEASNSKFDDAYIIEAYIENAEGFEGAGDLYSKFGLEIRDEATFIISKRQWNKLIGVWNNSIDYPVPNEGDILFLPMTNKFFEIQFVEHEQPFYQLSNLPVYKLQCSLYEYNEEDFETGVEAIDLTQQKLSYQQTIDYTTSSGNHYSVGEVVSQVVSSGITVKGEVQTINKTSDIAGTITVSNIGVTGTTNATDFIVSSTIGLVGNTSSVTAYISKIYDIGDNSENVMPSDGGAQNVEFEVSADGFLDFSEANPFGDPSDNY
tara:strand:+ start:2342 stop:3271 length:930 start_codon:yes stop_codon:yes gene_type:complete